MWGRVGYAAAIIGTVIGGAALCLVVAAVMYIGIYAFVGDGGYGSAHQLGQRFPFQPFRGQRTAQFSPRGDSGG